MSLSPELEADLQKLAFSLEMAEGEFTLIFAQCNYLPLQKQLAERLAELTQITTLQLTAKHQTLSKILEILKRRRTALPPSVQVLGLETMTDLPGGLAKIDQTRTELKKRFPLPIVVWVNDALQSAWSLYAPNMASWGVTKGFTLSHETVTTLIDVQTQQLLEAGWQLSQQEAELLLPELEKAREELGRENLSEKTQAQLAALIGLATEQLGDWQSAVNYYREGLDFESVWSVGAKGLLYRNFGWCGLGLTETDSEQIGQRLERSCSHLVSANREDWWQVSFPGMALTLMCLQQWEGLKRLLETGKNSFGQRESQVLSCLELGYQAVINWQEGDQTQAMTLVQEANNHWEKDKNTVEHFALLRLGSEILEAQQDWQAAVDWIEKPFLGMMSNLLLEKIDTQLPRVLEPKQKLKEIYLDISQRLQRIYFDHLKDYRKAFVYSQSEVRFKQQIGDYAFIGANRMEAIEGQKEIATALTAAGRDQDVSALVERVLQPDPKLIVLYGESGVGKSSLLQAGLVPKLKQQRLGQGTLFPVYLRLYDDKLTELKRGLEVPENTDWEGLTAQVQEWDRQNRRVIFIFDQFEEFFFANVQQKQQSAFFNWLGTVLKMLRTKVVLSLRKDYLHLLVDFSYILPTQLGILAAQHLYGLRNFTGVETRQLIERLTAQSQFRMSPELVKRVVEDLTGEEERIRPIELQILGAQCQEDNITDLKKYEEAEGKTPLLQSYVDRVTKACGPESADLAELILYLLTNDKATCPLKTQAELEEELSFLSQDVENIKEKLALILDIFLCSGLVFVPRKDPKNYYQLIHDYLADLIYTRRGKKLVEELNQTKSQLTETKSQLQQELTRARIAEIESLNSTSEALFLSHDQLGALLAAVKAGQKLYEVEVPWKIKNKTLEMLKQSMSMSEISELNRFNGHSSTVWDVYFSSDSQKIISASEDKTLKLWQIDGSLMKTIPLQDRLWSFGFSASNEIIATGGFEGGMRLWSLDSREIIWSPDGLYGEKIIDNSFRIGSGIPSLSFSSDGKMLACGSRDGIITLLSLERTNEATKTLIKVETSFEVKKAHVGAIRCIQFSPDSQTIASAGDDKAIKLWQIDAIKLWQIDGTKPRPLKELKEHDGRVLSINFNHDGKILASASADYTVKLWHLDSESKNAQTLTGHNSQVCKVSFSPDGERIASGSDDGTIKIWRFDGRELGSFQGHVDRVTGLSFSPDCNKLASCSRDQQVKIWNLEQVKQVKQRERDFSKHKGSVRSVNFSPDGQTLASAGGDQTIKLWTTNGNVFESFKGHKDIIFSVSFSPDGTKLASASADTTIKIWNMEGNCLHTLEGHRSSVYRVIFNPDGTKLASGSNDGTVKIWNMEGKCLETFEENKGILDVSFNKDGTILASSIADGTIKLRHLYLNPKTVDFPKQDSPSLCITFSPDGENLVSGSTSGMITLWNLDGKEVRSFKGHQGRVWNINFDPTGQFLASAGADKTIKIWCVKNGIKLHSEEIHEDEVFGISFSKEYLAFSSADGTVNLLNLTGNSPILAWPQKADLNLNELMRDSCDRLRDYLKTNTKLNDDERKLCEIYL